MLSFIYQLVNRFERKHGLRPNLLYLSNDHFHVLKACFEEPVDLDTLLDHLQMVIILTDEAVHPRVAWSPVRAQAV